jgi:ABC-type histidine transport system ATPase subunit
MKRYFIDCNSSISFVDIYGNTDYPGKIVVNEKDKIVYTVHDEYDMVTGEYDLWNSLTELANAIEG